MAYCAKCGTDIGEAASCHNCGEPSVYHTQAALSTNEADSGATPVATQIDAATQSAASTELPPTKPPAPTEPPGAPTGQPVGLPAAGSTAHPVAGSTAHPVAGSTTQPIEKPAEQAAPDQNQGYVSQPAPAQTSPQAQSPVSYAQSPTKANPLVIIAAIALIALGLFKAIQGIISIVEFTSLISSYSFLNLSMDLYPWPRAIFEFICDAIMIATGILALIFLKKPEKSMFIAIAAAITGGLVLIQGILILAENVEMVVTYGFEGYFSSTTVMLGFSEFPYLLYVLGILFVLFLALAAAVVLFICSFMARKKA